ncbi:aluminum-activated malate transporter 1-like [Typha angustifolia]|uniref:aluminum-activated malate transporter 1-like n=1 Tax=Typha angustifolia TaxID=59011 RepID=UPI003C30EAA6
MDNRNKKDSPTLSLNISICRLYKKLNELAKDDPRRVIHSIKVGLALSLASTFYFVGPLLACMFHERAMWSVVTVVLVMEFTVGGTLTKGLNRAFATLLASILGVGAHHLSVQFVDRVEPLALGFLVFLIAVSATFARFIPELRTRYDYGVMIFILTFCIVVLSSYQGEKLLMLAYQRFSTIAIGVVIALFTSILLFPFWAGEDLHRMTAYNLEKLATFMEANSTSFEGYKTVLNSKAIEDSLVNNARWEPGHGRFKFAHPWKQYTKIGALTRRCAYSMEVLHVFVTKANSQMPTELELRCRSDHSPCTELCIASSKVLKGLASSILSMTTCSTANYEHMAVATLASEQLKTSLLDTCSLSRVVHEATVISLLVEIVECVKQIVASVEELAVLAQFKNCEVSQRATVSPVVDVEAPHVAIAMDGQ